MAEPRNATTLRNSIQHFLFLSLKPLSATLSGSSLPVSVLTFLRNAVSSATAGSSTDDMSGCREDEDTVYKACTGAAAQDQRSGTAAHRTSGQRQPQASRGPATRVFSQPWRACQGDSASQPPLHPKTFRQNGSPLRSAVLRYSRKLPTLTEARRVNNYKTDWQSTHLDSSQACDVIAQLLQQQLQGSRQLLCAQGLRHNGQQQGHGADSTLLHLLKKRNGVRTMHTRQRKKLVRGIYCLQDPQH